MSKNPQITQISADFLFFLLCFSLLPLRQFALLEQKQ